MELRSLINIRHNIYIEIVYIEKNNILYIEIVYTQLYIYRKKKQKTTQAIKKEPNEQETEPNAQCFLICFD